MQTILVPTDFNISSLDCISSLCNQFKNEDLRFIFVHVFKLSDSMGDLLMLSRRSREFEQVSDEFYKRCNEIKAQNKQVKGLQIEFLYGSTLSMFKNFLEANAVNLVLDSSNCYLSKINKSSIDPQVLVQKCGLPIVAIAEQAPVKAASVSKVHRYEEELSEV
ncbi:hypothetical protein [Pedobacter metabolipauper]|uniref:Universal stress protein family protein n=1 Tax=Pedobacter metabolipauper TaxID=425513 RepID=A0A4R6STH6_9SPHI|nr:hypothetical protein [Pedobacter metabolipauper]TDQ06926.1 hypothetical protein ATK78_3939 [Pedobacter metabolipauper]